MDFYLLLHYPFLLLINEKNFVVTIYLVSQLLELLKKILEVKKNKQMEAETSLKVVCLFVFIFTSLCHQ